MRPAATNLLIVVVAAAWFAVAVSGAVLWARGRRREPADAWIALILGGAAFGFSLLVPGGPMGFAGASRLSELWSPDIRPEAMLLAIRVPIIVLTRAGLAPEAVAHAVFGGAVALEAALIYSLARAGGVSRLASVLAWAIATLWPAHARYAADISGSISTSAILTLLSVAGLMGWRAARRPELSEVSRVAAGASFGGAFVLAMFARAEAAPFAVLLLPMIRGRAFALPAVAGVVVAALATAVRTYALPGTLTYGSRTLSSYVTNTLHAQFGLLDLGIAPAFWYGLALVGLFVVGGFPVRLRLAWAMAGVALLVAAPNLGYEYNPLWGQSRYYLLFIPVTAVLAAGVVDGIALRVRSAWVVPAAFVVPAGFALLHADLFVRPVDLQEEAAFVRETAPAVIAGPTRVLALDGGCDEPPNFTPESLLAHGIATALGPTRDVGCGAQLDRAGVDVARFTEILRDCPHELRDGLLVFVGGYAPERCMSALLARASLVPVIERDLRASSVSPIANTRCRELGWDFVGRSLDPCEYRVGWYRLVPRPLPVEPTP